MSKSRLGWFVALAILCVGILLVLVPTRESAPQPVPIHAQAVTTPVACPYRFVSWNIENLGKSHGEGDIAIIARVLKEADIVVIQEVTAGKGSGAKAVARIAAELSRHGSAWDYIVSDPTQPPSPGVERYAILFKKHVITSNRDTATLVTELKHEIEREPFYAVLHPKDAESFSVYTIHAVPTDKGPLREIRAFVDLPTLRSERRAIIAGDFNLAHSATDMPFGKAGFQGHIREKTSLARTVNAGAYRTHQFDNIYTKGVHVCSSGVVDFVAEYFAPVTPESLRHARALSDHLPVFITFR